MTTYKTNRLFVAIAFSFGLLAVCGPSVVQAAPQRGCDCSNQSCTSCRQIGGCVNCPECTESFAAPPQEYCELNISEGKETRTCFEIDYKTICIPKVVPPWRQCCDPVCAETRSVKILKTRKYECPVCKYEWSVKRPEYQQPVNGEGASFQPTYSHQVPITQNAGYQPGYGTPLPSNVPVVPSRSSVPVLPAKTSTPDSFIVPTTPVVPPAPPISGSIGDYFGGR